MLSTERIVYCSKGRGFNLTAEADSVRDAIGKKMEEVITGCRACERETEKKRGESRWPCLDIRDKVKIALDARQ